MICYSSRPPKDMRTKLDDGSTVCTARLPKEHRKAWAARHYLAVAGADQKYKSYWIGKAVDALMGLR